MRTISISIVIPIYNVEKYISQCIESILKQTYKNYNIILVNDGSTDNSGDLAKEYARKCPKKIKYVEKENGGLSDARNFGTKYVTGEYTMFIDSDDFLYDNNSLKKIVKKLQSNNCEILTYKILQYNKEKYIKEKEETKDIISFKNGIDYVEYAIKNRSLSISACNKIIKTEFLKKNNLEFEKCEMSEDIDWSLRLYLKAKNIVATNEYIYCYRQLRENSITNSIDERKIISKHNLIKKWVEFDYKDEELKLNYYSYIAYVYLTLITKINSKNCNKKTYKEIIKYKWLLNYTKDARVKMASVIYHIFGIRITIAFLKTYLHMKNKNIIKIN
jgi:glycosyltransferase involved in cell wall biosynthesis